MILKTQQIFKSKKHTIFTGEVNKIAISLNDAIRLQTIALVGNGCIQNSFTEKRDN